LIKPNAARLALPGEGVTTHPAVVAAIIHHLREKGALHLAIGESCIFGVESEEAFRITGMQQLALREGVRLIDFDEAERKERMIPGGKVLKKIAVASTLREFDFIVSAPVMKTHMHTRVTLSIKNMKGLLWRREKVRLHHLRSQPRLTKGYKELDIAISEMASVLMPDLAVIDGIVGMEGMGPAYGRAKKGGIIVAGNQALSTDAVAARIMGFDPQSIPHLKLAAERGLGEIRIDEIAVDPANFLRGVTPFEPPPSSLSIPYPNLTIHDQGSCSACLSTLLVFLQRYHSRLNDYRLPDGNVHIGVGKHLKPCPNGTVLLGNCTGRMKRKGIFIQGCPPVGSQIVDTLGLDRREG
jgi:uncharacterized protein (DUF362 family)